MIITERKPIEEIFASLAGYQRVFLVGCGECATTCKTGGEYELAAMKEVLEEHGKQVLGMCIPKAPCVLSQSTAEIAKHMSAAKGAQAILICACGLGAQSVKQAVRWPAALVPACNTLFGAVVDNAGNFHERCSLCGECILSDTGGLCPTTLCAKGLLNGPCGGMKRGKCEVDGTRDCAWVAIYQELSKQQKTGHLQSINPPKNHLKSAHPHYIEHRGS